MHSGNASAKGANLSKCEPNCSSFSTHSRSESDLHPSECCASWSTGGGRIVLVAEWCHCLGAFGDPDWHTRRQSPAVEDFLFRLVRSVVSVSDRSGTYSRTTRDNCLRVAPFRAVKVEKAASNCNRMLPKSDKRDAWRVAIVGLSSPSSYIMRCLADANPDARPD